MMHTSHTNIFGFSATAAGKLLAAFVALVMSLSLAPFSAALAYAVEGEGEQGAEQSAEQGTQGASEAAEAPVAATAEQEGERAANGPVLAPEPASEGIYSNLVITVLDVAKVYDGQPFDYADVQADGLVTGHRLAGLSFTGGPVDAGVGSLTVASYEVLDAAGDVVTKLYQPAQIVPGRATIDPVDVYVTTPSASKTYDGTPLSEAYMGDDGSFVTVEAVFVGTDECDLVLTGSQTEVGSSANTYSLSWISGNPNNYRIVENIGTLTVLAAERPSVAVVAPSASKNYDGLALETYVADYTYVGLPDGYSLVARVAPASITDVGTVATSIEAGSVSVYDASGRDVTSEVDLELLDGELVVEPAYLYVHTQGDVREYNGTPLMAAGNLAGIMNNETLQFAVNGSQTEAGTSQNTYTITWNGTAKESNYQVVEDLGMLIVTPATPQQQPQQNTGTAAQQSSNNSAAQNQQAASQQAQQPAQTTTPAPQQPAQSSASTTPAATTPAPTAQAADTATSQDGNAAAEGEAAKGTEGAEGEGDADAEAEAEGGEDAEEAAARETGSSRSVSEESIEDESTPLASSSSAASGSAQAANGEEELADEETPLGVFDEPVPCWVHWVMLIGILGTIAYGGVVMFFRRAFTYELETREAEALGFNVSPTRTEVPAGTGAAAGKKKV